MKTARFDQLVKAAGKPEVYTPWIAPKKDRAFQTALKANRVLTVHQETVGSKADYGTVGYDDASAGEILIFPKPVKKFAGKRVVGLKYDKLAGEPPKQQPISKQRKAPKPKPPKPPRKHPEKPKAKTPRDVAPPRKTPASQHTMVAGIRKAMKMLDSGNQVRAYRVLEELLASNS